MPQLNTSLKPIKNILRCIRNQQKAKARTMAMDISSTFFFDSCTTRRFTGVVFPGVRLLQTLAAMKKYNTAITNKGKAYRKTKDTIV